MVSEGINVCRPCHSFIHRQFSEKILGRELNTLKTLLENEIVSHYLTWARKQH